ncbi:MAG TPA: DUF1801 domain-containing protein [Polyangiaceae bacterium]|jgi:hypothetical protein|nr:DUF1801 domain-containing protein [Polyangiaceae bacterium]
MPLEASKVIDKVIARHDDWRGKLIADVRRVIHEAVPDVTEEVKWMGTPTWSKDGILCICNPFKEFVKITFYNGAMLKMDELFNAELEGSKWRAIKLYESDKVDAAGLKKLCRAAVALNASKPKKPAAKKKPTKARRGSAQTSARKRAK